MHVRTAILDAGRLFFLLSKHTTPAFLQDRCGDVKEDQQDQGEGDEAEGQEQQQQKQQQQQQPEIGECVQEMNDASARLNGATEGGEGEQKVKAGGEKKEQEDLIREQSPVAAPGSVPAPVPLSRTHSGASNTSSNASSSSSSGRRHGTKSKRSSELPSHHQGKPR